MSLPHGSLGWVVLIAAIAFLFDFLNGMNDAANSIATLVSTRVLSPRAAVLWASFFNFAAAFGFTPHVAETVARGLVSSNAIDNAVLLGAFVGAALWDYFSVLTGLPTSSTHAIIGGLLGGAVSKAGLASLKAKKLLVTAAFIVISPLLGLAAGYFLMVLSYWVFRKSAPGQVSHLFKGGQLVSSALLSLAHGLNDAQKTMGLVALVLFTNGYLGAHFYIPKWVILSCYSVIALGTLSGGWRIIKTMGHRITKLNLLGGFCAETGAGVAVFASSLLGIPVSTTHTVAGAIVGVGATNRLSAIRWGIAGRIVWAWVLTVPCSALVSAGIYEVLRLLLR